MPWQNFSIWRARLPHWRADGVVYYATFRHRRPLDPEEREELFGALLKSDGRRWEVLLLCVLPETTELLATLRESPTGEPYELSEVIEKAKGRAGKAIVRSTGERFPPFYGESYDRIMRDDEELGSFWERIVNSPVQAELVQSPEEYATLAVRE
jgi:hypothetical protein